MTKYTEILKLKSMLERANIPFTFTDDFFKNKDRKDYYTKLNILSDWERMNPSYQIIIYSKDGVRLCDAVEDCFSYGNEHDLIEIMGALTEKEYEDDRVLGYLTAEEVFKRFKYCYENGTSIYKEVM